MTTRESLGNVSVGVVIGLVVGLLIHQAVGLDAQLVTMEDNGCGGVDKYSFDPPECPDGMVDDGGDRCYPPSTTACTCPSGVVRTCTGDGVCGCEELFCCNAENKCVPVWD